ncbi:MAG: tetratricopeptide repeat protein [Polyangiales bacterium]
MKPPPSFPGPHASDSDDVSWALCTAAALWKLGKYDDAVNWVQRAAKEAAGAESHPDSNVRVVQLTIAATELGQYVKDWHKGQDADPKSVAISIDFDTDAIEIDSEGTPIVEPPPVVQPPKLAPRAKTFAGTLPQDARTPLVPAVVAPKIEEKKPLAPRKGSPSLSRTLPEAMSSPLARRPSTAGPLGDKPRTPDAEKAPLVLDLGKKTATPDPFAGLDEPRLTNPSKRATPKPGPPSTEPTLTNNEPALTKRMDDVPTRRIAEGEAWPPADLRDMDEGDEEPKRKP